MSGLLKFQSAPGVAVGVIFKNSKHGRASSICRHCLFYRFLYPQNAQEFSSYVSPFKLLLVKKKLLQKEEKDNVDKKAEVYQKSRKTSELNREKTSESNQEKNELNREKTSESNQEKTELNREKTSELNQETIITKKKPKYTELRRKCLLKTDAADCSTDKFNSNSLHNNAETEKHFDEKRKNSIAVENNSGTGEAYGVLRNELPSDNITKINRHFKARGIRSSRVLEEILNFNRIEMLKVLDSNISEEKASNKNDQESASCIQESREEILSNDYLQILSKADKEVFNTFEFFYNEEEHENFDKFTLNINYYDSFIQFIESSTDILITNNKLKEAFQFINNSRKRTLWKNLIKKRRKNFVSAYNILLNGLSEKGQWDLVNDVIKWMKNDGIKLNPESFVAILQCLVEVKPLMGEKALKEEMNKILKELFANNVSLDDIFTKTKLSKKNTEKILSLIHEVVPFFHIKPIKINLNSDCPLIKHLYETKTKLTSPLQNVSVSTLEELVEEQIQMEKNFFLEVKGVCDGHSRKIAEAKKKKLADLKCQWRNSLTEAVNKITEEKTLQRFQNADLIILHSYINSIPPESLVDILMNVTETLLDYKRGFSPDKAQISSLIGFKISERYQIRKKQMTGLIDASKDLFKQYISWYLDPQGPAQNSRQAWQMLMQDSENINHLQSTVVKWPQEIIKCLGQYFLQLIIKEIKFTVDKNNEIMTYPAFYGILRYNMNRWREEIKCHPLLASSIGRAKFDILSFRADEMPMVCPPKPWQNAFHGGYLIISADLIRRPPTLVGKSINFNAVPAKLLYPTLDSLNTLQATPWRVNEDVLDVVLKVFKDGGSEELNVPSLPSLKVPAVFLKGMNLKERVEALRKRRLLMEKNMNEYGLWCEALYKLSLVNHFRKRMFWLPQNCDFRGRVYPVPGLLNHIGADLFRCLLVFADGKPLGPKGLDWLKIHVINLTGTHKKRSVEERLTFANEILPEILDSAENPLTGNRWWTKSDEPWQTLAGCIEIKKVLSHPDPENYLCSFPIHQDGSCNGLQHYAALGRDLAGAQSVNLLPFQTPQDVYSVIAGMIEEEREKDAKNGIEIAKVLEGVVDRKIVKQTVMTTVYGVTPYGARLQIQKKLEDVSSFPQKFILPASMYLSEKTFLSIKKMFKSAKKIQQWFISCADVICDKKEYVQWQSPLGLPILQHYMKFSRVGDKKRIVVPNRLKQKNAFPPNFIHTLDSCHMMLTALHCEQAGITFAAVHDCFWTHPCSVEIMNKICREQFIALHSKPILEDLSDFFKKTYPQKNSELKTVDQSVFNAIPDKGEFDLKEIMNSVYFFC